MRIRSLFWPLVFSSIILSSCEFHCSVGDKTVADTGTANNTPRQENGALLYNGIQLRQHNVKVDKAYLVTNDEAGDRVDEGNFVDITKGVKLVVIVKDGWKETNERVWLGASMKVVADNGETVLEKDDMFTKYEETGISASDAKLLGLSVFFTTWTAKRPVTLHVSFRVWDKKGDASFDGDYTINTK